MVRYNQLVHRLKLVPATAKRADGVAFELRVARDAGQPSELVNLDLKVGHEGMGQVGRDQANVLTLSWLRVAGVHDGRALV